MTDATQPVSGPPARPARARGGTRDTASPLALAKAPDVARVAALADATGRRAAARLLAQGLGADDLLIFLHDREVDRFLPAPGLTQTLRGAAAWRTLLAASMQQGEATGTVAWGVPPGTTEAWGVACGMEAVIVLVGGTPARARLQALMPLLYLVVRAAQGERAAAAARVRASVADDAAQRAEALSASLDRALRRTEAAEEEAARASRAKSDFMATMSHELRTPLNAIGGYAELLQMEIGGPLTPSQHEHVARIQWSQRHLLGLINSILNFSRIESGHIEYAIGPVPVGPTIDQVVILVEPQARARGVAMQSGPFGARLCAHADVEKLRQIMLNLLANAVKFTESGGTVTVRAARARGGLIAISVIDTGIGISSEQCGHVFDPFFQVGRRLSSGDEGVGLGLAISRDLARAMGGDITVESRVGSGSTFCLTLPDAEATPAPDGNSASES